MRRLRLPLVVAVLLSLAVPLEPPTAGATSASPKLTMFAIDGSEGDFVSAGLEAVYRDGEAGAVVSATGTSTGVTVRMQRQGATTGMGTLEVTLGPPRGSQLVPGVYEGAMRPSSAPDNAPRLDVSSVWAGAAGSGCNQLKGRFTIREAAYDPQSGAVRAFAATFEQDCEGHPPTLFGEVRFNSDVPFASRHAQLRQVPLVVDDVGDIAERLLTIMADGPGALQTGQLSLAGGPVVFSVAQDGCSNRTLATGESCDILVRYLATGPEREQATLTLPDNSARGARRFVLQGLVATGPPLPQAPDRDVEAPPSATVFVDRSAYNEGHQQTTYQEGHDGVAVEVSGNRFGVHIGVSQPHPQYPAQRLPSFGAMLEAAPGGDTLEAGRDYIGAVRALPREGPEPGLSTDWACNRTFGSFRVYDIGFDGDGMVARLAAAWTYVCEGSEVVEAGEVRWHSTVPLAARALEPDVYGLYYMYFEHGQDHPSQSLTLTSTGTGALAFGQLSVEGQDAGEYVLRDDSCSEGRLRPGDRCSVTVEYRPRSLGAHRAVLVIPDNTALGGLALPISSFTDRVVDDPTVGVDVGVEVDTGYWMAGADGTVYAFGHAGWFGNAASTSVVDLEPTVSGHGYWIVDEQGRVFALGDAVHHGQPDRQGWAPDEKATSLSATTTGNGYWVFTSRGRVLSFGDAKFLGDTIGLRLAAPVLDSIVTGSGQGYFMVAADGGIFAFGDARFAGSMGGKRLNSPVQSLVPDPDGRGYWLVAGDGGVFAFDAPFRGSMGDRKLNRPVTGMVPLGDGYLMVAEDGGIFAFSNKPFLGSLGDRPPARPVVAVAALPAV